MSPTGALSSKEWQKFDSKKVHKSMSHSNDCWATIQWRHNEHDGVSNHQPHDCLLSRLFRHRSKKTSKLRVIGLVRGIRGWPVISPHKGPVTRKMIPLDDVIMDMPHYASQELCTCSAFVVLCCKCWYRPALQISFRVTAPVLGQSYDWHNDD